MEEIKPFWHLSTYEYVDFSSSNLVEFMAQSNHAM